MFAFFDKDKDGAIMSMDVIRVVRSCGLNPSQQEVKDLLNEFDPDGRLLAVIRKEVTLTQTLIN